VRINATSGPVSIHNDDDDRQEGTAGDRQSIGKEGHDQRLDNSFGGVSRMTIN